MNTNRRTKDVGRRTKKPLTGFFVPRPTSHVLRLFTGFVIAAALALFVAGCATSFDKRGVYHSVRSGDTIWRVARFYRVDVQTLAEFNNILSPDDVQPGMKLYIPPDTKRTSFKKLPFGESVSAGAKARKGHKKGGHDDYSKPIEVYRGRFDWPVEGRAGSLFGMRSGRRHDGLDIGADAGTKIKASADGRVVFAGQMRGYGNLILVRHEDDFFTAYAHNQKNIAKKGENIKKGQTIGIVGSTGRASAPHLHFEIRHGQTARNPLFFLPERESWAMRQKSSRKK